LVSNVKLADPLILYQKIQFTDDADAFVKFKVHGKLVSEGATTAGYQFHAGIIRNNVTITDIFNSFDLRRDLDDGFLGPSPKDNPPHHYKNLFKEIDQTFQLFISGVPSGEEVTLFVNLISSSKTYDTRSDSGNYFTADSTNNLAISDFFETVTISELSDNIQVSAVPVPAAVWLFGSGLIGLWGVRKKSSTIPMPSI